MAMSLHSCNFLATVLESSAMVRFIVASSAALYLSYREATVPPEARISTFIKEFIKNYGPTNNRAAEEALKQRALKDLAEMVLRCGDNPANCPKSKRNFYTIETTLKNSNFKK